MPLIKEFAGLIDFAGFGGFMKLAILQILVNRETFPNEKNNKDDNNNWQNFYKVLN